MSTVDEPDRGSLAGQVALVTGASGGIGSAIARALAAAGAGVGLLGRDAGALDPVRLAVEGSGGAAAVVTADVTRAAEVEAAVAAAASRLGGPVDLLVDAAGRIESAEVPVWEAEPHEWWEVVETNLRGPFHLVRAVVPGMVARGGGRVVHLSSGIGARDSAIYSGYAASKAALFRLGGALALAGAEHGVRAFEVAPGRVRTPMTAGMPMHAGVPDERWTAPEHVAAFVVAVAEGRLDAWSGRYLRVDADDVARLAGLGGPDGDGRLLRVLPYGPDDPLG